MRVFCSVPQHQNTISSVYSSLINHGRIWGKPLGMVDVLHLPAEAGSISVLRLLVFVVGFGRHVLPLIYVNGLSKFVVKFGDEETIKGLGWIHLASYCLPVLMKWIHKLFFQGSSSVTFARFHLSYVPGCRFRGGAVGVAWKAGSNRGTRRSDWLTICLWDWTDVWVERPISICFQVHFLSLCVYIFCCECNCVHMSVCIFFVCALQCACFLRFTPWLTQVPVGLIVFHMEWVNREQVLVIMKSCLVSSTYGINRESQCDGWIIFTTHAIVPYCARLFDFSWTENEIQSWSYNLISRVKREVQELLCFNSLFTLPSCTRVSQFIEIS